MADEEVPTTEVWIKTKVLRRLGNQLVKVEIDDDDWTEILDDTYRWWIARKGVTKTAHVLVMVGVTNYKLPADFKTMEDWIPPKLGLDLNPITMPFALMSDYDMLPGNASDMILFSQASRIRQIAYGCDPEIKIDLTRRSENSPGEMILHPVPTVQGLAELKYVSNSFTANDNWDVLQARDQEILLDVVEAFGKQIVGRKRSKFGDMALPGGGTSMDGQALLDEARASLEQLEQDVFNTQDPMPIMIG